MEDRINDTIEALKTFQEEAKAYGADRIVAMATSAVREAKNKEYFINKVYEETGIEIDVLSGIDEARIGCVGVQKGLGKEIPVLIIDIGGGSTEFIVYDKEILYSESVDVGAVRMTEMFVSTDPVVESEYISLKQEIKNKIFHVMNAVNEFNYDSIIGIGGTATTFGSIDLHLKKYSSEKVHNHKINFSKIVAINEKFKKVNLTERKNIVGLEEKRADIILAGGTILQEIIEESYLDFYRISDYDNLEGYLIEKCNI
jgi:exopolyphosphatase/guanosine-5'-triphosphate,3'-diphosphate pyrophosphatase